MHVLDGIGGGGSEEWVRDIVALSPAADFAFTVCYLYPRAGGFDYEAELRALGAEVRYVGLHDQWFATLAPRGAARRLALRAVRGCYYRWIRPWLQHLLMFLRLYRAMRETRPTIVHCHVFYAFVHGVLAARAAGVRRILYTVSALRSQTEERYGWIFGAYRRLGSQVERFFTGVSAEELTAVGIPSERITLFRGGANLQQVARVPRETNPLMNELGLRAAHPIVLLTGRFNRDKGQAVAVQAVRRLVGDHPNLRVILLGEGEELEAVRSLVRSEGLAGSVLLPGFRRDLAHFYSLADVYWRTALLEGMNRAAYLAAAYGLPIVAFDTGAVTEGLRDGETALLVPPGDAGALAEATRRLLVAPELARRLGEAVAAHCRREWDILTSIEAFDRCYRGQPERPAATVTGCSLGRNRWWPR